MGAAGQDLTHEETEAQVRKGWSEGTGAGGRTRPLAPGQWGLPQEGRGPCGAHQELDGTRAPGQPEGWGDLPAGIFEAPTLGRSQWHTRDGVSRWASTYLAF